MTGSLPLSRWHSSNGWIAACRTAVRPRTLAAIASVCAALAIACASGCARRTVLVPSDDTLMRVGPGGAQIRVWYHLKGEWVDSGTELRIPEGWYLLPPQFVEE